LFPQLNAIHFVSLAKSPIPNATVKIDDKIAKCPMKCHVQFTAATV